MRLPLILISLATNVLWISADDVPSGVPVEKDLFYTVNGFEDKCELYSCSVGEHSEDAAYLNRKCLVNVHPECKDELFVTLTEDHTTLIGASISTESELSPVLKVNTPLFPGPWILTNGQLRYPQDAFVGGTIEHCGLYYQEGRVQRDFRYWHPMPTCHFKYHSTNKYHALTCTRELHSFGKTADTFYFAVLSSDARNCFKSIADLHKKGIPLKMQGILRFYKDGYPSKIALIREDHAKYTIKWDVLPGSNHTELPSYCSTPKISWDAANECTAKLAHYNKEYFITSIHADVSGVPGNAVQIRNGGRNSYIPAMYVDFPRLMFFDNYLEVQNLNWDSSGSSVAFNLDMNGTANLYIEWQFGLPFSHFRPKGKYQLKASGSHPYHVYDPYLINPIWKAYEKVIFLDKEVPDDAAFVFDGFFEVRRMQPTTTTTTTTTTTRTTSTTTTTTTTTTPKPTTHLQSVHELGQLDAKYRISWLSGCGTVSQECHNSLHLTDAQACVDKASNGCSVKISAAIEHPLSLSAVEASINGEKILVPAVFYDPTTLFFASIRLEAAELADYTFGDQAEGDLYISEHLGGNPPQGKEKDSIVHLSLNKGQYIYLDQPIKSSDRKFIFTGTIAAVGVKAGRPL